jgi:hypothetical protein
MNAFKPGDKVLIEAFAGVTYGDAGRPTCIEVAFQQFNGLVSEFLVPLATVHPAPKPLYVDPELVPGMVVAPLDAKTPGSWWVAELPDDTLVFVGAPAANLYFRRTLPAEIRVVFDPREATS